MRKMLFLVLLFFFAVAASSIAEEEGGYCRDKLLYYEYHDYTVDITSMPSGAKVYIHDELIGNTPLRYKVNGKVSKISNFVIRAKPQMKSSMHYPGTFKVSCYKPIPRNVHFDLLKKD